MRINIKLWIAIIVLSAIVILLRYEGCLYKRNYLIDRDFKENSFLKQNKKSSLIDSINVNTLFSKNLIVLVKSKALRNEIYYKLEYFDRNTFNKIKEDSISTTPTAELFSPEINSIYYIDRFNLFEYTFNTRTHVKLTDEKKIKCFEVSQISDTSLMLIGEAYINNEYHTGFFLLNLKDNSLKEVRVLDVNSQSEAAPNTLVYSGRFTTIDEKTLGYYCDKYSKIFLFNGNSFEREFQTTDRTPKPQTTYDNIAFYYKRGYAYNVNNAIMKVQDRLYVFSCRSNPVSYLIVDVYNYNSNKYLFSFKVDCANRTCRDIFQLSSSTKNVIVNFQDKALLFNIQ